MYYLTLEETCKYAQLMAKKILKDFGYKPLVIYGLPRGGISTMFLLSRYLTNAVTFSERPEDATIIVEDIYDTGKTAEKLKKFNKPIYFLIDKREVEIPEWIAFPWESEWKKKFGIL